MAAPAANSASLLALAERNVPRYTSYPTAPHFSDAVGPQAYASWLEELPATMPLSLYLHVPLCSELCLYCGCTTKAVRRQAPIEAYAQRLKAEIRLLADRIGGRKVVTLHWGGGTPSILGAAELVDVFAALTAAFDVAPDAEHAIELDPRRLPPEIVATLAELGVTRASLGVQDFSLHVQEAIGRIQPFEQVESAIEALRSAGIANINMDLMYGLPRQTIADVIRTAELAATLSPTRLAVFGYAHVPWFKSHQRLIDESCLPGVAERIEQMRAAAETLERRGYVRVGIDHFASADDDLLRAAQSGRLHRNFQGYTTDQAQALIGLGASAIGRLPQGYAQNAPDIGSYMRAIDARQFAVKKGVAFSPEDRVRARIIERLMCDFTVDLDDCDATDDFSGELSEVDQLRSAGIVVRDGRQIFVTREGRPLVRLVAAAFDSYLPKNQNRHSAAV